VGQVVLVQVQHAWTQTLTSNDKHNNNTQHATRNTTRSIWMDGWHHINHSISSERERERERERGRRGRENRQIYVDRQTGTATRATKARIRLTAAHSSTQQHTAAHSSTQHRAAHTHSTRHTAHSTAARQHTTQAQQRLAVPVRPPIPGLACRKTQQHTNHTHKAHIHTKTHTHTHNDVCMYVCVYGRMYVCVHVMRYLHAVCARDVCGMAACGVCVPIIVPGDAQPLVDVHLRTGDPAQQQTDTATPQ
jgi:hypothetical protein